MRVHPAQNARGQQAPSTPIAPPPTQYPPVTAPNAAMLIDFDNVTMGIRSELAAELKSLLSSDVIRGKLAIRRAYADWRRYPQYVLPLTETSIDLIYAPAYGSLKKNATDIRLAIDAMELVFTRPEIGTVILLSGDSDFSSLVIKLKEYGKYVIGVGIRESSSDLLVQNCDEYYSYNALAGLVKTGDEPAEKWDPWELAGEAIARMKRNGDVMRADRLKQVMQEIDNNFDEKNVNLSKFSRFVAEAAQRGILHMSKLENGQLEVDLPRTTTDAGESQAAAAAPIAPAREVEGEAVAPREAERGHGRGRRGGRRDRGRSERRPHATNDVQAAPPAHPPAQPTGERLTRSEAFDLVRRAVDLLSGNGTKSFPAQVVREKAQELLARESETLSERHFPRILHDAHDAEVIDLKRRGDDFEVSRSTKHSVGEQLNIAAAATATGGNNTQASAATARPAAAPAAPARTPPRSAGRAAFGKRIGEAPAHLLSIGVVDTTPAPVIQSHSANSQAEPVAASAKTETATKPKRGRASSGTRAKVAATTEAAPRDGTGASLAAKSPARKRARKTAARKIAVAAVSGDADATAANARRSRKGAGTASDA